jgi:hypothetical protein
MLHNKNATINERHTTMKLDVAVNEAVLSNTGATGEFKIRNSAKAFKILSDGLYSNKIRAIIRELSCNAVDSHVAAGKSDVPFEVHLPTMLGPWFSVRDFGTGLSGDEVTDIYTTYFESTKTDSNDFIGALGLGSKSPFSYTENFTVTAIKDGFQRIYSAYINESGIPCVAEMTGEATDLPNGVEVKFSVTNRTDYNSFIHEAADVFSWFKLRPVITGHSNFHFYEQQYREKDIVPGIHYTGQHSYAVMGNIAYSLDNVPEKEKHFGDLSPLLTCGLVIEFDIGELDFSASRETLSFIPLTLGSIKKKLELLNENLSIHLASKADAIEDKWERAFFLYSQYELKLYKAAVIKYVNDTNFPLFDLNGYHGVKTFKLKTLDLENRGLSIKAFRIHHGSSSMLSGGSDYVNGNYEEYTQIDVRSDVNIVLNDLKTGCTSRARYHFTDGYVKVYCISHSDPDLTVRQAEYDKLMSELHNPPNVVLASTLRKREKVKAPTTQGIAKLTLRGHNSGYYRRHRSTEENYTWAPYHDELTDKETYCYVCLNNHTPINPDGTAFTTFNGVKELMVRCGVPAIENIKIFGVRKSKINDVKDLSNWVCLDDKLREEVAKIDNKDILSMVASSVIDSHDSRVYTNSVIAKKVSVDSDYAKFLNEFGNIKKSESNVSVIIELCGRYGKSIQIDALTQRIKDSYKSLHKKYPLLEHIARNTPEEAIAEYINLIDRLEKV